VLRAPWVPRRRRRRGRRCRAGSPRALLRRRRAAAVSVGHRYRRYSNLPPFAQMRGQSRARGRLMISDARHFDGDQ
jgi:hypothetical protein